MTRRAGQALLEPPEAPQEPGASTVRRWLSPALVVFGVALVILGFFLSIYRAKGFNVPIIHVNADDVEACVASCRLAMAYRERWGRDVVIDLIGYRRYGHNETDEAAYTQPLMAARIKGHPPVSELCGRGITTRG